MNTSSDAIGIIYFFLVVSGMYAIILSLYKLAKPHKVIDPNATIQTKLFKLAGPIGFIYGIFVIILVIYLVRNDITPELQNQITKYKSDNEVLKKENKFLKAQLGDSTYSEPNIFTITVYDDTPFSLFNGSVLIEFEHNTFSSNQIYFKGIIGISDSVNGSYNKLSMPIEKGDKLFIKLVSNIKYGINVLFESTSVELEFYKIK